MNLRYTYPAVAVAALLLFLILACASTSPAPDSPATVVAPPPSPLNWTPSVAHDSTQAQGAPRAVENPGSAQTLDCLGSDFIKRVRAEYAANHLRAKETYIGQRVCLRGTISDFYDIEGSMGVRVIVGEGARFSLGNRWQGWSDEEQAAKRMWEEWVLSGSVGDPIEAECEIKALGPVGQHTQATPGIPVLVNCKWVVQGDIWVPPTPTPVPTSTPLPCAAVGFGDRRHTWLNIDCSAGKVTIGMANILDESENFQALVADDSAVASFYFTYVDNAMSEHSVESHWKQWIEESHGEESVSLVWEAPTDVAAKIISEWRYEGTTELAVFVGGPCCNLDLYFDLAQPPAPAWTWQAAASTPTPTPEPTADGSTLIAAFEDVPASHNGNDAVQFRLRFSEPVSTSYKVLRDQAIQVEGGTVKESKRVDGRSDLWRVTIEPDGSADLLVSLTAPTGCDSSASVCTETGKALSNSPAASIPYRR